jgi:hypothetical protein
VNSAKGKKIVAVLPLFRDYLEPERLKDPIDQRLTDE